MRAFHRRGDDTRLIQASSIESIEGDICDTELLTRAASGCSAVFHTAGNVSFRKSDRAVQYRINVEGTRAVVEACRQSRVSRLVYTSTANMLGAAEPDGALGDENTPFNWRIQQFNYAITKKMAETIALSADSPSLEVVAVNPGTVFGPGDVNANAGSYIIATAKFPVLFYPLQDPFGQRALQGRAS